MAKKHVKQKAGQFRTKGAQICSIYLTNEFNPYLLGTHKGSKCVNCQELLSEIGILKALAKTTVFTQAYEITNHTIHNMSITFPLNFLFHLEDIRKYIESLNIDNCWFNATIDTNSGKLVSATVGDLSKKKQ